MFKARFAVCVIVATLGACGSDNKQTNDSPAAATPTIDQKPDETPAAKSWDDLNGDEKRKVMVDKVMPAMKPLFQAYNAQAYAKFGCKTCHGANAAAAEFKMPNGIKPLDPTNMPSSTSADPQIAQAAKFMAEQVVPKMSEILGTPVTCFSCHGTVGQ